MGCLSAVTPVITSTSPVPCFSHLPDTVQLCSINLHFPESKDCKWFLKMPPWCSLHTHPAARTCKTAVQRNGKAQWRCREGGHHWESGGHSAPSFALLCVFLDKLFFSLSQVSTVGSLSPRRSLYRTLSDESVCSNRKGSSYASSHSSMLDQAMPNDILFSTTPPYHSTLPPRMIHNQGASNLRSK